MRPRRLLAPVFASALVFLPSGVRADLDPSFSADGLLVLDGYGDIRDMMVSGDQIVSTDGGVAFRYSVAGVPDASFGTEGVSILPELARGAVGVAPRSGGGYWLGSSTVGTVDGSISPDLALIALTSSGQLDTSFGGGDGIETLDLGQDESARAMAVDDSGNILVAGQTVTGSTSDVAVARFTPAGVPDATFGTGGAVVLDAGVLSSPSGVATMPSGEPVVVGTSYDNGEFGFVARLTNDGEPDSTFDGAGVFVFPAGTQSHGNAVEVTWTGQIFVGGSSWTGDPALRDFFVTRLMSDGSIDPSFGKNGYATADFGGGVEPADILVMDGGSIIVVGTASDFVLTRFTKNGVLDPAFGRQITNFSTDQYGHGSTDAARTVELLTDGRVLLAGSSDGRAAWALYKKPLPPCTEIGRKGSETLIGTRRADVLCPVAGDDIVRARGGADIILGGDGNDRLYGEKGPDVLRGDHGQDLLDGGPASDKCDGGTGKDRLVSC